MPSCLGVILGRSSHGDFALDYVEHGRWPYARMWGRSPGALPLALPTTFDVKLH